jgi:hypothetical protein
LALSKKTWACTLLGESTNPGSGGGGENLPETALPVDSLRALDPFRLHDLGRTACQLLILIQETHIIAEPKIFKLDPETGSLNSASALTDRGLHLRNAGTRDLRVEQKRSACLRPTTIAKTELAKSVAAVARGERS